MNKNRWKYIVIEHPTFDGLEIPIIFPDSLEHSFVGKLGRAYEGQIPHRDSILAAGFCEFDQAAGMFGVDGGNEALGIKCRPGHDNRLLEIAFVHGHSKAPAGPLHVAGRPII